VQRALVVTRATLAVIAAIALLVIGTAIHQTLSNGIPVGLFAGGLLLFVFGLVFRPHRFSSWIFSLTFAGGMIVVAAETNRDAILPANFLGFAWSYGAIGLAFLVSLWPRIRIRPSVFDNSGKNETRD